DTCAVDTGREELTDEVSVSHPGERASEFAAARAKTIRPGRGKLEKRRGDFFPWDRGHLGRSLHLRSRFGTNRVATSFGSQRPRWPRSQDRAQNRYPSTRCGMKG